VDRSPNDFLGGEGKDAVAIEMQSGTTLGGVAPDWQGRRWLGVQEFERLFVDLHVLAEGDG
jgi:hypothetical protein